MGKKKLYPEKLSWTLRGKKERKEEQKRKEKATRIAAQCKEEINLEKKRKKEIKVFWLYRGEN